MFKGLQRVNHLPEESSYLCLTPTCLPPGGRSQPDALGPVSNPTWQRQIWRASREGQKSAARAKSLFSRRKTEILV